MNIQLEKLKAEARSKIEAKLQHKTRLCNKEKIDKHGKVIVQCCYGTKFRFLHKGEKVRARTSEAYVINRMIDQELARMVSTMKPE